MLMCVMLTLESNAQGRHLLRDHAAFGQQAAGQTVPIFATPNFEMILDAHEHDFGVELGMPAQRVGEDDPALLVDRALAGREKNTTHIAYRRVGLIFSADFLGQGLPGRHRVDVDLSVHTPRGHDDFPQLIAMLGWQKDPTFVVECVFEFTKEHMFGSVPHRK
jgi:hypothetical protein